MVSSKYFKIIMLLLVLCVDGYAQTVSEEHNNSDGIIVFSEDGFKGQYIVLKPGYYLINELPISNIKSIKILNAEDEMIIGDSKNFGDEQNTLYLPSLEESLNISSASTNLSSNDNNDNNTSTLSNTEEIKKQDNKDNLDTSNTSTDISSTDTNTTADIQSNTNNDSLNTSTTSIDTSTDNNTIEENDNKAVYTLDNIDISKYDYLYVAKVDLNNGDGIASHDEYDSNTGKYFGRYVKTMKEIDDKEKDNLIEISIDTSPEFQGLPDLTKYKNLKNIKLLFNVLQEGDKYKTFGEQEYNKIIDYIDKVHPLTIIEMQGNLPSYSKTQNKKFFGFNLETFPSISTDVTEMHLINCKKLSSIDFSKYKNLQKIYMYGNTLESANAGQWKKMIEQLFTLALNTTENKTEKQKVLFWTKTRTVQVEVKAKLIHIQLPRTFTGEIPKVGDPTKSQLQYLSALGATSVAQSAFDKNQSLNELYLPNVKEVKSNAFRYCENLETVSLDKCEVLQLSAFDANLKLKNMHLPVVKKLCKWSLVYTENDQVKIGDLNNVEFRNSKVASVYLPFCEELGERALGDDSRKKVQIVSVNLPRCKTIGENAMRDLYKLKEVNIPEVETIGKAAFENDGELTKVGDIKNMSSDEILLPKVKSIADYAFKNDDQMYVKDKIKAQNNTIKSIILPECESIGRDAFMRYRTMEKLSIPKCKSIGKLAFYDAYKLQKIEAPLLETIENRAFMYASSALKSFKTVNEKEELDNFLEFPKLKKMGVQVFGGSKDHNIGGAKIMKLPECTQMENDALQGSRITELEAPKINNKTQVLSKTQDNIAFNKTLLEKV